MRPGPLLLRALAALAAVALLLPWLPALRWPLAAGLLLLLGRSAHEILLLRRVRVVRDEAGGADHVLSLDEVEPYALALRSDAAFPLEVTARAVWPALLELPSTTLRGRCLPGQILTLRGELRGIERGVAQAGEAHLGYTRWGLAERLLPAHRPGRISVLPNLREVGRLHRRLQARLLRGLGQRMAPRLGKGREFDRLREYQSGDDIRDLAWKATARHAKLIVRDYRLDRSQDVLIAIDTGHRMAARTARISRIDHAVNAALQIAYITDRLEDRVGLLAWGAEVEAGLPQGRGAAHLRRLTAYATSLSASYVHSDPLALPAHLRRRLRHRSLVLIITALPEPGEQQALLRAVRLLRPTHLPLVLVLSDPDLEAAAAQEPQDAPALCRVLVAREVVDQAKRTRDELSRLGAWVVSTPPASAGIEGVNAYLEIKRRQML